MTVPPNLRQRRAALFQIHFKTVESQLGLIKAFIGTRFHVCMASRTSASICLRVKGIGETRMNHIVHKIAFLMMKRLPSYHQLRSRTPSDKFAYTAFEGTTLTCISEEATDC